MAVTMSGEFVLPAERATVWAHLNDVGTLRAAIPGCESLDKLSDTEFVAVAKVKIGPVSARFKGRVALTDIDAPNSYRIAGQGDGGIAGFAKGGANVRLADADGGGTRLSYDVDAQMGGKIAQLGGRLIDSTAKKLADEFFDNFARALNGPDAAIALGKGARRAKRLSLWARVKSIIMRRSRRTRVDPGTARELDARRS